MRGRKPAVHVYAHVRVGRAGPGLEMGGESAVASNNALWWREQMRRCSRVSLNKRDCFRSCHAASRVAWLRPGWAPPANEGSSSEQQHMHRRRKQQEHHSKGRTPSCSRCLPKSRTFKYCTYVQVFGWCAESLTALEAMGTDQDAEARGCITTHETLIDGMLKAVKRLRDGLTVRAAPPGTMTQLWRAAVMLRACACSTAATALSLLSSCDDLQRASIRIAGVQVLNILDGTAAAWPG